MLDKERNLLMDMNSFCQVEAKYGDFNMMYEKLIKGSPLAMRAFLWAGLIHEDPDLKEEDVFRFVPPSLISKLNEQITDALLKNSQASPKTIK